MALKSTIFKADLQLADLDRGYFAEHALTLARHPSETDERLMVRLLAFALYASDHLAFGRGLSNEDEPALREDAPNGEIERWIDVGLPDERAVRRACHRARQVVVLTYGGRAADIWWQQAGDKLAGLQNLRVLQLAPADTQALAALAARTMRLQCTIQEGTVWLGGESGHVELTPNMLLP